MSTNIFTPAGCGSSGGGTDVVLEQVMFCDIVGDTVVGYVNVVTRYGPEGVPLEPPEYFNALTGDLYEVQGILQPCGAGGGGGEPSEGYVHHQEAPASTWTVVHNLNTKPDLVLVVEPDLTERVYTAVTYPDMNTAVVEWPSPESGWAYAR